MGNVTYKTVEDYLNTVDYLFEDDYVPTDFALLFVNFIKLVNGTEGESHKTPLVHFKMLDTIVIGDNDLKANLCHRGMAKTTLLGEYLILYIAVYGNIGKYDLDVGMYVSDSMENGVKSMRKNLEYRYNNSAFLQSYITKIKFTDDSWEFFRVDGSTSFFKGFGVKTGVRGFRSKNVRPQIAILDDLISDDDARSPTIISSVEDVVYKALNHALDPTKRLTIWLGTPFNARDPLYKAVESGAWDSNVFPVCEKFPCTKEEFRGSWPDRFTYEFVKKQYDTAVLTGTTQAFYQELMLRIISEDMRILSEDDIRMYSIHDVMNSIGNFNIFITTDFATSSKESNDNSFISVWALSHDGTFFWLDGVCKKQTMDKNIEDLFKLVTKYNPMAVGIETNGQQGGFVQWIESEMIRKNIFFNLGTMVGSKRIGINRSADKFKQFLNTVPLIKAGKIRFPTEGLNSKPVIEAMDELRLATGQGFKSKHDDFIDTLTMLTLMETWRPSASSMFLESNNSGDGASVWKSRSAGDDHDNSYSSYTV